MKKDLRQTMLARRNALSPQEVAAKSQAICEKVWQYVKDDACKTVMAYIPLGNETDMRPLLDRLLAAGKRVAAPICGPESTLIASQIENLTTDLAPGYFGILTPKEERPIPVTEIDAVVVPGISFDPKCNRLGFGGGYYDRFLPRLRNEAQKIAVCFDCQISESLEAEPWDCPVDLVVTETKIYKLKP